MPEPTFTPCTECAAEEQCAVYGCAEALVAMPLDIYGHKEFARLLGISHQRMNQLQGGTTGYAPDPGFPCPSKIKDHPDGLACGPIWDGPRAREYARTRRTRAVAVGSRADRVV